MNNTMFQIRHEDFKPTDLELHREGESWRRVQDAVRSMKPCKVFPRNCSIDHFQNEKEIYKSGRYSLASDAFRFARAAGLSLFDKGTPSFTLS